MKQVQAAAEAARIATIDALAASPRNTRETALAIQRVDDACKRLCEASRKLSLRAVAQTIEAIYPGQGPAYQTLRNSPQTSSLYRDVVTAWRTYALALQASQRIYRVEPVEPDLADALLNTIEPASVRVIVFAMRAELRHLRARCNMLQSLPRSLVMAAGGSGDSTAETPSTFNLSPSEREALMGMLNLGELATRGGSWSEFGELLGSDSVSLSRAGFKEVLERVAEHARNFG